MAALGLVGADGSLSSSSAFNNPLMGGASPVLASGGGGGSGSGLSGGASSTFSRDGLGKLRKPRGVGVGRGKSRGRPGGLGGGGPPNRFLPPLRHSASEPRFEPTDSFDMGLDSANTSAIYNSTSQAAKRGSGGGLKSLPRVPVVKRTLSSDWLMQPMAMRRTPAERRFYVQPLYDQFEVEFERNGGDPVTAARAALDVWTGSEYQRLDEARFGAMNRGHQQERADSLHQWSNTSSLPER